MYGLNTLIKLVTLFILLVSLKSSHCYQTSPTFIYPEKANSIKGNGLISIKMDGRFLSSIVDCDIYRAHRQYFIRSMFYHNPIQYKIQHNFKQCGFI